MRSALRNPKLAAAGLALVFVFLFVSASAAFAQSNGDTGGNQGAASSGFEAKTAADINAKLKDVIVNFGIPVGIGMVALSLMLGGGRIVVNAYNSQARAEAITGIGYVLLGALIIGGVLVLTGVIVGIIKVMSGG